MTDKRIWVGVGLLILGVGLRMWWQRPAPVAVPGHDVPFLPGAAQPGPQPAQQDWRSLMEAGQLAQVVPALEKLVRPAIQLTTRKVLVEALAVGQSRIGGVPDLPAGFKWPTYQGKHLAFVAQINLREIARVTPDGPLPKEGQLWFFYAWDQTHWGFDPKDAGSSVVHYEADARLARRELPDDVPKEGQFAPCAVTFRAYDDIPDGTDDRNPAAHGDDATQERYTDARISVASIGPTSHKLLGYPEPVQDEMESQCAAVTHGIYMGDAKGSEDPRFDELVKPKYDWRLLMQVDSDDAANMMWGDAGKLYFWIRDQDLRARHFDKAWMILQCG
jgi:uncharacterized protein YwqG